jgi:hypothetical protein
MTTEVENPVTCDDCGSTKWQGGPKGGSLGRMYRCENGHDWTFYFGILNMWDKVWMKHRAKSTLKVEADVPYKDAGEAVEEGSW